MPQNDRNRVLYEQTYSSYSSAVVVVIPAFNIGVSIIFYFHYLLLSSSAATLLAAVGTPPLPHPSDNIIALWVKEGPPNLGANGDPAGRVEDEVDRFLAGIVDVVVFERTPSFTWESASGETAAVKAA